MAVKFWWPTSMPAQLVLVQNFKAKIGNYASALPLTAAQVTAAVELCDAFVGSFNAAEQCRQTMIAMTKWRDDIFSAEPVGAPSPAAPVFPVVGAVTYTLGSVTQFFKLRDLIVASPGYSQAMGEDLGIVGAQVIPPSPDQMTPQFKSVSVNGATVNVSGSMQGMDAMRVEYAPNGGSFRTVAFLTNTPGGFTLSPEKPNQPETGQIRAVYIKRNSEVGNFSANYPVTVA